MKWTSVCATVLVLAATGAGASSSIPLELKSAMAEAELLPLDAGYASDSERLGGAVAMVGDLALVGAPSSADLGVGGNGDVLVFALDAGSGTWNLEAQLLPSDLHSMAFGAAVDFDGVHAVIGAPGHDTASTNAGAVYVFRRDAPGQWTQVARLTASDADFGDNLGSAVAIDGDVIVAGAPFDDDPGSNAGAAYIFAHDGSGTWTEQQKLIGADSHDRFGHAVDVGADVVAVGAPFADGFVAGSGAAYAYRKDAGGVWQHDADLQPATGASDDVGASIAVAQDRIVVGAPGPSFAITPDPGAVHVFEFGPGGWEEGATLLVDGAAGGRLGAAIAVSGDTIIAGADRSDVAGSEAGIAHVFRQNPDETWTLEASLTAAAASEDDWAGGAVALSGTAALVGIPHADDHGSNTGAAVLYRRDGLAWSEEARLTAGGADAAFDLFGYSVALDGNYALVGALRDDSAGDNSGAAYIFENAGDWQLVTQLLASDPTQDAHFGSIVALQDGRAVIAATAEAKGKVYIFDSQAGSGSWTEQQILTTPPDLDGFGFALALDGDRLVIGGYENFGERDRVVLVFEFDAVDGWQETTRLKPQVHSGGFGDAVDVSGDYVIAGARLDDVIGRDAGAAWVFERGTDGTWTQGQQLMVADGDAFDYFGTAVAVHGEIAAVASPIDDSAAYAAGAIYVFERSGGSWQQSARLLAQSPYPNEKLGTTLALDQDVLVAGTPLTSVDGAELGSAVVFRHDGQGWLESNRLFLHDGADGDDFASTIGVSGEQLIVGAPFADRVGTNAGLAAIWSLSGNAPPVAQDDFLSTDEDSVLAANLLADNGNGADGDADGEPVIVVEALIDGQAHVLDPAGLSVPMDAGGTLTIGQDGGMAFDPVGSFDALATNELATVSFSYTIADPADARATAMVVIEVRGVDDLPVPMPDLVAIVEDSGPVVIDVLANDPDPDGGDTVIWSLTTPTSGSARLVQFGRAVEFTPEPDTCTPGDPIIFDYFLAENLGATVSVDVQCVDDPPHATADSFTITEDEPTLLPVLANDTDIDGGPMFITSFTPAGHGLVEIADEDAGLLYSPDADYCSQDAGDAFSYTLNGGSQADVIVFVTCVDDPGQATDDAFEVLEDSETLLDVLANDTDVDGGSVVESLTPSPNATIRLEGDLVSYLPNPDYCGPDVWGYTLNGGSSAQVLMDVLCVNDPPRINPGDVFEPTGAAGPREVDALVGLSFGGADESSQSLVEQTAFEFFDFDNVVEGVSLDAGTLRFDLTGNDGSADIAIWLRDDGGIENGGVDTSETIVRVIVSADVVPDLVAYADGPHVGFPGEEMLLEFTVANEGLQAALADITLTPDSALIVDEVSCSNSGDAACSGSIAQGWLLTLQPADIVVLRVHGRIAESPGVLVLLSDVHVSDLSGNESQVDNNIARLETSLGVFFDGFEP